LDYEKHGEGFSQRYWNNLPQALTGSPGAVLPGVSALLTQLKSDSRFSLGILTGNAKRAAEIKLQHFDLDSFFDFGGYGDHNECRNEVAQLALNSATEFLQGKLDQNKLWVLGDTVNDIKCARSISSRVVAVETGGACNETLREAAPDAQFESLADSRTFLSLFD
jgi:phosphoglycolate phosphatase-like HAD superfamily hydrolase